VTGGARRIGAAITRELHRRGCRVWIHHHSGVDAASSLRDELNALRPDSALLCRADLCEPDAPFRLAEQVLAETPVISLLVNNASRFFPTPLGSVTPEAWRELMGSNVRGAFFLSQALLPALSDGAIVNILDIHAERPQAGHAVYCMAKSALAMMTRSLALDLAPSIRVNGVAPGAILWPSQEPTDQHKQTILQNTPLARLGTPDDVAEAVAWLGLDAAYVTGQVLAVDGGRSLNI